MKIARFVVPVVVTLFVIAWCGYSVAIPGGEKQGGKAYGKAEKESAEAAKAVKLTVKNRSGKHVRFVSWRYWGDQYYFYREIKNGDDVTADNFAAEWRIVGVWDNSSPDNPISHPGWGASHNFNNDTTITINKNTLVFK